MLPRRRARLVQVVLDPLRRRDQDLLLLIQRQPPGHRHPPDPGRTRTPLAGTSPRRGPDRPPHRRARAARLLPWLLLLRPFHRPPLLPGRLPSRLVIRRRRHRGVPAVPRPPALRCLKPLPQVSDHGLQRRDTLRLRGDALRLLPDQCVRGSAGCPSGDGASVTARHHPGNHAEPPPRPGTRSQK